MEKYAKTAINQTNKNSTQRTTIKSNKRKAIITTETNKEIPIRVKAALSIETAYKKEMARYTSSDERGKPTTKITLPSKDLIQI